MPKKCIVWETSRVSLSLSRNGLTLSSNIGFISRGGPGSMMAVLPCCSPVPSMAQPGAVPLLFGKMMQPCGIIACFLLFSVIGRFWRRKWHSMRCSDS